MKTSMFKISIVCVALIAILTPLEATYFHGDDFFPIGLTGLGFTGSSTPYGKGWEDEMDLIDKLGINCIGCEDAWQNGLIDFAGYWENDTNTYLNKICIPLADERADTNCYDTVYLITASYGVPKRFDKNIIFKYTEANL